MREDISGKGKLSDAIESQLRAAMDNHKTGRNLNKRSAEGIQCGILITMSDSNRGRFPAVVTAIFVAVLVGLVLKTTWELSSSNTEYRLEAEQISKGYADRTPELIQSTCVMGDVGAYAKCVDEIVKAANEAQTAQRDLAAQRSMALWAAAMFWATFGTVVVAAIGIYYVRNTLLESRRIGQAQVRAYLADDGFNVSWANADDGRPTVENIEAIWKNTGLSPALSCGLKLIITGLLPEEAGNPIEESVDALKTQQLGTVSIAVGGRALCGGTSLTADQTADWLEGRNLIIVHSLAAYKDVFGNIWKTETCHQLVHITRSEGNKIRFKIYAYHNSAT